MAHAITALQERRTLRGLSSDVRSFARLYDLDIDWISRVLGDREPQTLTVSEIRTRLGLSDPAESA